MAMYYKSIILEYVTGTHTHRKYDLRRPALLF